MDNMDNRGAVGTWQTLYYLCIHLYFPQSRTTALIARRVCPDLGTDVFTIGTCCRGSLLETGSQDPVATRFLTEQ